jgi:hypothetical protein
VACASQRLRQEAPISPGVGAQTGQYNKILSETKKKEKKRREGGRRGSKYDVFDTL